MGFGYEIYTSTDRDIPAHALDLSSNTYIGLNRNYDEGNQDNGVMVPDYEPDSSGHRILNLDYLSGSIDVEVAHLLFGTSPYYGGEFAAPEFIYDSGIKLWAYNFGQPTEVPTGTAGETNMYIEGIAASLSQNDTYLTVTVPDVDGLGNPASLINSLTVVDLELEIDGLSEMVENDSGAIIWRNSDFSKDNEETAGGTILPDYAKDGVEDDYKFDFAGHSTDLTEATLTWNADAHDDLDLLLNFPDNILVWDVTDWKTLTPAEQATTTPPRILSGDAYTATDTRTSTVGNMDYDSLDLLIEGVDRSGGFAQDQIYASFVYRNMPWQKIVEDRAKFTVVEVNAGADGNRDGVIDFTDANDRQLTFWYNNDNETIDADEGIQTENVSVATSQSLFDIGVIDFKRDLEDLSRLAVSIDPLLFDNATNTANGLTPNPKPHSVTYTLSASDPDTHLNLYHSVGDPLNALSHVTDPEVANEQQNENYFPVAFGSPHESPIELKSKHFGAPAHLRQSGANGFLLEAFREDKAASSPEVRLTVTVSHPDGSITDIVRPISLSLMDIADFYNRYDVEYLVDLDDNGTKETDLRKTRDENGSLLPFGDASLNHVSTVNNKPFFDAEENIVFVHGWNLTPEWKRAFADTAYKRLYWQGFQGTFNSFEWPTFANAEGPRDGWFGIDEAYNLTYNPSELQAYRSGNALKNLLDGLDGDVHLVAHSMGNVVSAEALRLWNFEHPNEALVNTYVATEAAISSGAYGETDFSAFDIDGTIELDGLPDRRVRLDATRAEAIEVHTPVAYWDLMRYWSGGTEQNAGGPYMYGTESAATKWVNMYNPEDLATNFAWKASNYTKDFVYREAPEEPDTAGGLFARLTFLHPEQFMPPPEIWPWRYWRTPENGPIVGEPTFELVRQAYTEEGVFDTSNTFNMTDTMLTSDNQPGLDGYEVLAFLAVARAAPVGTRPLTWFNENVDFTKDIGIDVGALGGANEAPLHSFQFHFDAATTAPFWESIRQQIGFESTLNHPE